MKNKEFYNVQDQEFKFKTKKDIIISEEDQRMVYLKKRIEENINRDYEYKREINDFVNSFKKLFETGVEPEEIAAVYLPGRSGITREILIKKVLQKLRGDNKNPKFLCAPHYLCISHRK